MAGVGGGSLSEHDSLRLRGDDRDNFHEDLDSSCGRKVLLNAFLSAMNS